MKKAAKKVTKKQAGRLYTLTAAGQKFSGKGTHAQAALSALKELGGKATGSAIADYVTEKELLESTKMDPRKATSWILSYLVRLEVLKTVKK